MKNVLYASIFLLAVFFSCKKEDTTVPTYKVSVQLKDTLGNNYAEASGLEVTLTSTTSNNVYNASADATGLAVFSVPIGIYKSSVSFTTVVDLDEVVYNGNGAKDIVVTSDRLETTIETINLVKSERSQIVIKEIFVGGTESDNGATVFGYDRYIILYNNSSSTANLSNLCLATTMPYNSTSGGSNKYYDANGALRYTDLGWIPAGQAFWYFRQNLSVESGKQIVVALTNAVNNTLTYSKSINFDNPEYYAMYDILQFSHVATYVSPAASIPESHYLKAIKYGAGTAWTLSQTSPGLFIFTTKNTTPQAFGDDASSTDVYTSPSLISKKVPVDWIIDGVDAFNYSGSDNKKRLTTAVDAGSVLHTNNKGYSIYRNVDEKATLAIPGNADKIKRGYNLGTKNLEPTNKNFTTDESGIDAEASIKNGARIVYLDNNNSTKDFHLRSKASLRTN